MLVTAAMASIVALGGLGFTGGFFKDREKSLEGRMQLIFKRCDICVEAKESGKPKEGDRRKLYPELVKKKFEGAFHHPVLYYKLPPGLPFTKIFENYYNIKSGLHTEVQMKWLEGMDSDGADIRIKVLVGKLKGFVEWNYEDLEKYMSGVVKNTKDHKAFPFPIAYSREQLEFIDFANDNTPHIYIAGETGGGKTSLMRSMITFGHLFYKPDELRNWYMDLKDGTEFQIFYNTTHTDRYVRRPKEAKQFLMDLLEEEYRRLELFQKANVVKIGDYNKKFPNNKLPRIIAWVDELGLLEGKQYEEEREIMTVITAFGRACGVGWCIGTHRPDNKVMSGTMKMNIPVKIAFWCNPVSARVILDENHGKAMEYLDPDVQGRAFYYYRKLKEIQAPFIHPNYAIQMLKDSYIPSGEIVDMNESNEIHLVKSTVQIQNENQKMKKDNERTYGKNSEPRTQPKKRKNKRFLNV